MNDKTKIQRSSVENVAIIGDVHGCLDELRELHKILVSRGIDRIFHVGDLVDRGPDSGGVVAFCRENGIEGVCGNHEGVILARRAMSQAGRTVKNTDKARTIESISSPSDWLYIESLPSIIHLTSLDTVIVHAGLWPSLPLEEQPWGVGCVQMVHPDHPGKTRWWHKDRKGTDEAVNREAGWRRWYEVYNLPHQVVVGHSVFMTPLVYDATPQGGGRVVGVETGSVFGGSLTALLLPSFEFVSVKARRTYFDRTKGGYQGEA